MAELLKSREGAQGSKGKEGTRTFLLEGYTDGFLAVQDASQPSLGDAWSAVYPTVKAKRLRFTHAGSRADGTFNYEVVIEYSDHYEPAGVLPHSDDDVTVMEDWNFENVQEHTTIDLNGNVIGPKGEGADVEVVRPTLKTTCYYPIGSNAQQVLDARLTTMYHLVGRVNNATFRLGAIDHWFCGGAALSIESENWLKGDWTFKHNGSTAGWQYAWYSYIEKPGDWAEGADGFWEFTESVGGTETAKIAQGSARVNKIYYRGDFGAIYP